MIRLHMDAPTGLTLDIAGKATMVEAPTVERTAIERVEQGARVIRMDLRDCEVLDSTFSGTLLGLKRRLDAIGGELVLVSPSPCVLEVLRLMGLEDFYSIDVAERVGGPWQPVTIVRPETDDLKRLILESHQLLSDVPGPAGNEFRSVVEELRRPSPLN